MSHQEHHAQDADQERELPRVLHLDQAMRHQALMEGLSLCQEMLSFPIPLDLRRISHQIALRLAYVISHDPPPQAALEDLRFLAQKSQAFLASSLAQSIRPETIHSALRNLKT